MSGWVKTSDAWFEEARIEEIGADAAMLHLSGLAYSARHITNGLVPHRALRRLYPVADVDAALKTLTEAGLWRPTDGGFLAVDWADHILSADEVEHLREKSRISSERNRRHDRGDHSKCDRCWYIRKHGHGDPVTDPVTDGSGDSVSDRPPIRTEPNRPEGEGRRGEDEAGGSASSGGSAALAASSAPPPWAEWAAGPPPGIIPAVNGIPVWGPGSQPYREHPWSEPVETTT